jgi:signal transduction histidine kinase
LQVSDSGPGVPPEVATRIFDPYFTTKSAGLGMGLMICRTIIESHGGSLRLLSGHGHGAIFRFTLPVAREHVTRDVARKVAR